MRQNHQKLSFSCEIPQKTLKKLGNIGNFSMSFYN